MDKEEITTDIDQLAIDARFKMEGEKVTVFQGGQDGWETDLVLSAEKIITSLTQQITEVELIITETQADSNMAGTDNLGIKEIIGTGYSDFSGSPFTAVKSCLPA